MKLTLILMALTSPALASEPDCKFAIEAQNCSDGSGRAAEVKEAARQFRKACSIGRSLVENQAKLKSQCEKPGKKNLEECLQPWDKQSRSMGDLLDRAGSAKKAADKLFLSLVAPTACEPIEKSKESLRELVKQYDLLAAYVKPGRDEARSMNTAFQQLYLKTLLPMKNPEPAKHYHTWAGEEGHPPPTEDQVSKSGYVDRVTAYRLALEVNFPGAKDTVISVNGAEVKVTAEFARVLRLEGSGVLSDGRLVNSAGGKFITVPVIKAPFGLGSHKRTPLVPYLSIAVDPKEIPLGSTVFIYEARGMPLPPAPDGSARFHDGYFKAIDIGGSILGTHIDVFSGPHAEDYAFVQKYFFGRTVHYFVMKPAH